MIHHKKSKIVAEIEAKYPEIKIQFYQADDGALSLNIASNFGSDFTRDKMLKSLVSMLADLFDKIEIDEILRQAGYEPDTLDTLGKKIKASIDGL